MADRLSSETESIENERTTHRLESSEVVEKDIQRSSNSLGETPDDNLDANGKQYPTGARLVLIIFSLCIATLLVALDATIIATAIPTISSAFDSLDDVAWYNSAFLLTTCAFQIPFGRAYTLLGTKWVFLASIFIFEIGSAVCGAAPTSLALIIGRALQGVGGAGIFSGCFITIANSTPLRKRSIYAGFLGGTFAIASAVGPVLGGVFTTRVSWRWCFYINLPIGAVVLITVAWILPRSIEERSNELKDKNWWQTIAHFDPVGTILFVISIVCLQLALQWQGSGFEWSSPRVIATLVIFSVLFVGWIIVQWYEGENASIPFDVLAQRSVAGATLYTFFSASSFTVVVYYLPIWFQAIKQDNAEQSGIHTLPLVLSLTFSAIISGVAVAKIGYYTPFIFLGTILISVAGGLLMLLQPGSGTGEWIGYQILYGVGIGVSVEQCNVAIQAVLPPKKIPAGTSLAIFSRSVGGSLAVTIAQNVFESKLRANLDGILPNSDVSIVGGSGATNLLPKVEEATGGVTQLVDRALYLYNDAVSKIFMVALILAAISVLPAFLIEWKNVKKDKTKQEKEGNDTEDGGENAL